MLEGDIEDDGGVAQEAERSETRALWYAAGDHRRIRDGSEMNTQYSVIIVRYVLVRIANSGETLSPNCSVELCYQIDDAKFQDGCQNSKWLPFFMKNTVFCDNCKFCVS